MRTNISPKISLIVPAHNTSKYLFDCLDSIKSQTLKEIEVVVVNDASKDNSKEIITPFLSDHRFNYIEFRENLGTYTAKTYGAISSKGQFIGFIDSDDWLDKTFCERMYNTALSYGADIVECRLKKSNCASKELNLNHFSDHGSKIIKDGAIVTKVLNREIWHILANKIFKRSLFDHLVDFYKSIDAHIIVADDKLISLPMFYNAKKMICIKDRLYTYRYRSCSASNSRNELHDKKHIVDTFNVDRSIAAYFKRKNADENLMHLVNSNALEEINLMLSNISTYPQLSPERDSLYKELIKFYKEKVLIVVHGHISKQREEDQEIPKMHFAKIILEKLKDLLLTVADFLSLHYPLASKIYNFLLKIGKWAFNNHLPRLIK